MKRPLHSPILLGLILPLLSTAVLSADERPLEIESAQFTARFSAGWLSSLTTADGHTYVRAGAGEKTNVGLAIHLVGDNGLPTAHRATISDEPLRPSSGQPITRRYREFDGLEGAEAGATFRVDAGSGDLIVNQHCQAAVEGVCGVSWSTGRIPPEYAIIVPGRSGIRLDASAPGRDHQFDYPIGWEAQLVIVEGPDHGFYVWADDAVGRFKRLIVHRGDDGWRLTFVTFNTGPFDRLTECESVDWRLNVYQGDWRVPASRYRDWAQRNLRPTPIEQQRPGWVKDTRAMVIMGLDREILAALPDRFDPGQTVLYLPSWRAAGYDRDYPVYDDTVPTLRPFVQRAHGLGFRVMLHVNYFGVDPLNERYEQFEPFQVRDPWNTHEKLWWHWTRAEPEIKFAYINPALKAWRDHFTQAMVTLCTDYEIDALHLDQTLCIWNDHNGLIDGQTMLQGNIALHRRLRQALPDVALSGEGLNEATYRHEAFAQRHAYGLNHADGTWNRRWLRLAHPICSYLFRPYTIINGYLGYAPPTAGQIYPAWNEAYQHWGVIPTLKPNLAQLREPTGFSRQLLDEAAFWQQQRLEPDMQADWSDDTAFPFRTRDGRRAERTVDGQFLCQGQTISRTLTGATEFSTAGSIPGWRAYDEGRMLGLDPDTWYPCFPDPPDAAVFHLAELPRDMTAEVVADWDQVGMIRVSSRANIVADLTAMLDQAESGSRPFHGRPFATTGPFTAPDGAQFQPQSDDTIAAHPCWKVTWTDPDTGSVRTGGSGVAYARYTIDLPTEGRLRLVTGVKMEAEAMREDRSDGATFGVTVVPVEAAAEDLAIHEERHHASETTDTIELDLTPLAGRRVQVELTVHPGADLSPSYDWARWIHPRIERSAALDASLKVAGSKRPWRYALDESGRLEMTPEGTGQRIHCKAPGTVVLLRDEPAAIETPVDLAGQPRTVGFLNEWDHEFSRPGFVGAGWTTSTVGGIERSGLFAHPPQQGRTLVYFPMTLPAVPARLDTWVGIRDGSESTGVEFLIEVNGSPMVRRKKLPDEPWQRLSVDLSRWRGHPVVISLVTDSLGSFSCDWAHWGEPRITEK